MSAAPESVDAAVSRPSRQDLVIPPRSSSWPVAAGVVASAALVAIGLDIADPLIGFAISAVILKITWDSWRTIRAARPVG